MKTPYCIFVMEDWSPGQFYVLDNPSTSEAQYLRMLFLAAHQALNDYPDQLSVWGKEVAERLVSQIPVSLASIGMIND